MTNTRIVLGQSERAKRLSLVEPDHGTYHATAAARVAAAGLGGGLPDINRTALASSLASTARAAAARRRAWLHGIRTVILLAIGLVAGLVIGSMLGCGGSVEATPEERVAPPTPCGTEANPCPRQS